MTWIHGPEKSVVAVIGAGAWGTAIANVVARNAARVTVWARDPDVIRSINENKVNQRFLPGLRLMDNLTATSAFDHALRGAQVIVWAIPVQYTRERLKDCARFIESGAVVINLSKGLETDTWYRPSQIIAAECMGIAAVGTLGGPNIASEVARGLWACASLAVTNHWELQGLESLFCSPSLRVSLSPDLLALELSGALKNVVAIGAGICDGCSAGANAKAALVARGFEEMQAIGKALSANPAVFANAFSLGDLLTTCYSAGSRNRSLGEQLGKGLAVAQALESLGGRVAEGVPTAIAVRQLSGKLGLVLPVHGLVADALERECSPEWFAAELRRL